MKDAKLFNCYPTLENEDISLHKITVRDFEDLYEIYSNDALYLYRPTVAKKNRSVVYSMISQFDREFNKQKAMHLGIYLSTSNKLIGMLELFQIDTDLSMVNIGYTLNEAYWGQGLATKSVKLLLDYLFHVIEVNRVQAYVLTDNIKSKNVLTRNKFCYEGTIRQSVLLSNKGIVDIDVFSYLKQDYPTAKLTNDSTVMRQAHN